MHWCKGLSRCFCAEPLRGDKLRIEHPQSSPHGPIVWHRQALFVAGDVDVLQEFRNSRTLTRQEEPLDDIVDHLFNSRLQKLRARSSTTLAKQ